MNISDAFNIENSKMIIIFKRFLIIHDSLKIISRIFEKECNNLQYFKKLLI